MYTVNHLTVIFSLMAEDEKLLGPLAEPELSLLDLHDDVTDPPAPTDAVAPSGTIDKIM